MLSLGSRILTETITLEQLVEIVVRLMQGFVFVLVCVLFQNPVRSKELLVKEQRTGAFFRKVFLPFPFSLF